MYATVQLNESGPFSPNWKDEAVRWRLVPAMQAETRVLPPDGTGSLRRSILTRLPTCISWYYYLRP